jgi:hypothetical protein
LQCDIHDRHLIVEGLSATREFHAITAGSFGREKACADVGLM